MNKSGNDNRSVRNTKRRLTEGLLKLMEDKPINMISVKELTELVDVNRGTFYFHYNDTSDMLAQLENEFFCGFERVLDNIDIKKGEPAQLHLTAIFAFLGENKNFGRILLGKNGDMAFVNRLKAMVDDKCSSIWRAAYPDGDGRDMEMFNAFLINGCIGIIERWLLNDLREPPDEVAALAARMIVASADACANAQGS